MWRSILLSILLYASGLLLAAGVPALLVAVQPGSLELYAATFLVALAHALLLGLPTYWLIRTGRPIRWWQAAIGGALIGALPIGLFSMTAVGDASVGGVGTVVDGTRTAAGWLEWARMVASFGALGGTGGLAFWAAVRHAPAPRARDEAPGPPPSRVGVALTVTAAAAALAGVWIVPAAILDRSCHNPMRGRSSLASEINLQLELQPSDWPAAVAITQRFARQQGWSYRGDLRLDPSFLWLQADVCDRAGTQFLINGSEQLPGVMVSVYQPQGGTSWRGPFVAFYRMLDTRWPGRVRVDGGLGEPVPPPAWLAQAARR